MQQVWLQAQLKAPARLQGLIPRLHALKELASLARHPRLPCRLLQGHGAAGPLTVGYVGCPHNRVLMKRILFEGPSEDRSLSSIPLWRCREALKELPCDLIVLEVCKYALRLLPAEPAIIIPSYVEHVMDVRGDWQGVLHRFHKSIRKNELRLIRKHCYEYVECHSSNDFEEFYHQMYLPTMRLRHQEAEGSFELAKAALYFQHGALLRITRNGRWVAGAVVHPQGKSITVDMVGVVDGDARLIHEAGLAATFYASIHWSHQQQYEAVNFLGSGPPFLKQGLFRHKSKWGMSVRMPSKLHRRIWLSPKRMTPAVARFLVDNPVVTVDRQNALCALRFSDTLESAKDTVGDSLLVDGIAGWNTRTLASFGCGHP